MDRARYETPYGRDQYEWCLSERISASRGTPYPCDQYDLDECTFGSDRPPRSQHSRTSATANLENFLRPGARIDSVVHAAVARLRAGLRIHDWKPDLLIKAFNDLDIVFFGGKLRGHTTIRWHRASRWIQQPRPPQGRHHPLVRTKYLSPRKAAIQLNAWGIFLDTPNIKEAMWKVTLHEMVHAYVDVMCGVRDPTPYEQSRGWHDGHGLMFRRLIHAVHERAMRLLNISAIGANTYAF
ncbi:hypothetical protein MMC22_011821 [Lobaria immixta]|nr:hypothetical protein [Lobaria immixta]